MTPHRIVQSGDVQLAVYTWGEAGSKVKPKPTLVLVHGYPDSAHVWKTTAEKLAARYYVVAYDVRGAGRSSRPKKVRAYVIRHLMNDLSAVIDAMSPQQPVHLLCHDWGSIQCWEAVTTSQFQGRLASYTTISGPSIDHAGYWVLRRLRSGSPKKIAQVAQQVARSWYISLFQLPVVAPALWKAGLGKRWPTLLERFDNIKAAERNPTQTSDGAVGVNLYRANFIQRLLKPQRRRTDLPVQLIHPTRDRFVLPEIWDDLPQWAPQLWRRDADAGHWIQISHPKLIADWTSEFVDFVEGKAESPALQNARVTSHTPQLPPQKHATVATHI